ncbi:MAG TPA: hypothetical protein DEO84_10475 [candidate division Zixibacteria bacterium]|nr:hypothetical protein [candidate division Zixibacteria bacterium]HBZ01731.1 hypothetical protein [candidate division Zixibacteria bacterium]
MRDKEIKFIIISLIMAAIVGGFLGQLIGEYLPDGAVKTLFVKSMDIGIGQRGVSVNEIQEPIYINLYSISLAFGLLIKINFVSLLMIILVIIYFKWWYL